MIYWKLTYKIRIAQRGQKTQKVWWKGELEKNGREQLSKGRSQLAALLEGAGQRAASLGQQPGVSCLNKQVPK